MRKGRKGKRRKERKGRRGKGGAGKGEGEDGRNGQEGEERESFKKERLAPFDIEDTRRQHKYIEQDNAPCLIEGLR